MRILLTGATGTAGSGVLRAAIADPGIEGVTVLARRAPKEVHEKVLFVRNDDFLDYSAVKGSLVGHDAALWCLGTSQNRVDRPTLHRITVDVVVAGAKALMAANPHVHFLPLSGSGADPTQRARMAFAKEKGQAEVALDRLGLAGLWHFRPGYIHPKEPVEKPLLQDRLMWLAEPLFRRVAPQHMVDADDLGRAMLEVAKHGHVKRVLENRNIRRIAGLAVAE
jgi:uncharacterized protein YbjT (DUF2867 family)